MSLLLLEKHEKAQKIAEQICEQEFKRLGAAQSKPGQYNNEMPFDGLVQTIVLLDLAVRLNEEKFYRWTGAWIFELMGKRIPMVPEKQIKIFVIQFCSTLKNYLWWLEKEEEKQKAVNLLDAAIDEIKNTDINKFTCDYIGTGEYQDIKKAYMENMLNKDIDGAIKCIFDAVETNTIFDIYTKVIQPVMYEVGELWLENSISIAQEHYCSSVTQSIMAMLYPRVMNHAKNGRKAVIACIGSELHELGARMVSDLLECNGWDTVFLGAGLPEDALLEALKVEKPDLCGLSVSLQQGLYECEETVSCIKEKFPEITVAVGGHAFFNLEHAENFINADIYAPDSAQLLEKIAAIYN